MKSLVNQLVDWLELVVLVEQKNVFSFDYKGDAEVDGKLANYYETYGVPFNHRHYLALPSGGWMKAD